MIYILSCILSKEGILGYEGEYERILEFILPELERFMEGILSAVLSSVSGMLFYNRNLLQKIGMGGDAFFDKESGCVFL